MEGPPVWGTRGAGPFRFSGPHSMASSPPPSDSGTIAAEIDIQTSLALCRATTRAVCAISDDAKKAMVQALEREAQVQADHGGQVGELVAALITGHAQDL